MNINKDIYKELQPFAVHLRTAFYGCYYSNLSQIKVLQLLDIARKAGYVKSVTTSCNNCVLRFLHDIGEAYFKYEQSITENKKKKTKVEEQPIVVEEQPIVEEEIIQKGDN